MGLQASGRVHSIETFGTVDGPGTRMVVFLSGCPMRCAYCHNPDTWDPAGGEEMSVGELLERFERCRPFYRRGGITLTGGEPLVQAGFAAELFAAAHASAQGRIHTCLDTSGATFDAARCNELLDHTDLVLLDVKHADRHAFNKLCAYPQDDLLACAEELTRRRIATICRHVVVPGLTDTEEDLRALGHMIGRWPNVCGLELLPYHTMGREKYRELGIDYRLDGVPAMDKGRMAGLRRIVLDAIAEVRHAS